MSRLNGDIASALNLSCINVDSVECLEMLRDTDIHLVPTIIILDNDEPKVYEGMEALELVNLAIRQMAQDMVLPPNQQSMSVEEPPHQTSFDNMVSSIDTLEPSSDENASVRGIVRPGKSTQELADAMLKEREREDEELTRRPPQYNDIEERMGGFLQR